MNYMQRWLPIFLAGIFTIMAVAQLTGFEDTVAAIAGYTSLGQLGATIVAILLCGLEIVALPILLDLQVNRIARLCSSLAVLLAPLGWLILIGILSAHIAADSGLFGSHVAVPVGIESFVYILALWVLSLYCLRLKGIKFPLLPARS